MAKEKRIMANEKITREMAREFYRDLKGTVHHGDCNHASDGIMPVGLIADYMGMSIERANAFLRRCACEDLELTELQGGAWVV